MPHCVRTFEVIRLYYYGQKLVEITAAKKMVGGDNIDCGSRRCGVCGALAGAVGAGAVI